MPEPNTLKINEIFWSIQGEGTFIGSPTIFIRLSGCSLRCPYCDSRAAWEGGETMEIAAIAGKVADLLALYPYSCLVITGGEPLEQDLSLLLKELRPLFLTIALETNGTLFQDLPIDWWTVSPKDQRGYRVHPRLIPLIAEMKFIVNDHLDLPIIQRMRLLGEDFPIFLQPPFPQPDRYVKTWQKFCDFSRLGVKNLRLGVQLHRLYKIP